VADEEGGGWVEEGGDRGMKGGGRGGEVLGFGEEADNVEHANLTDAGAGAAFGNGGFWVWLLFPNEGVVAVPDGDVVVVDLFEGGEGVGYGVGDGEGLERRFPKTEIG